jgi:hypothetical protein
MRRLFHFMRIFEWKRRNRILLEYSKLFFPIPSFEKKRNNRNLLRYMMLCVGISPINKEWFHFQLPQSLDYPVISIEDSQNAEKYNFDSRNTIEYYDIFHDYQNDIFESKMSEDWII